MWSEVISSVCAILGLIATVIIAYVQYKQGKRMEELAQRQSETEKKQLQLNNKQLELSNKQSLFDKRLEKFLFAKDLISLYEHSRVVLDDSIFCSSNISFPFIELTNTTKLGKMTLCMKNPLNKKYRNICLSKLEMIKKTAEEFRFLWNSDESELISEFLKCYYNFLRAIYRQVAAIYTLSRENEKSKKKYGKPLEFEVYTQVAKEWMKHVHIPEFKDKIEKTYQELIKTNALETLSKSIDLGGQAND